MAARGRPGPGGGPARGPAQDGHNRRHPPMPGALPPLPVIDSARNGMSPEHIPLATSRAGKIQQILSVYALAEDPGAPPKSSELENQHPPVPAHTPPCWLLSSLFSWLSGGSPRNRESPSCYKQSWQNSTNFVSLLLVGYALAEDPHPQNPSCYKQSWQNSTNFFSLCVSRGSRAQNHRTKNLKKKHSPHSTMLATLFRRSTPPCHCWLLCSAAAALLATTLSLSARSEFSDLASG